MNLIHLGFYSKMIRTTQAALRHQHPPLQLSTLAGNRILLEVMYYLSVVMIVAHAFKKTRNFVIAWYRLSRLR